MMDTGPSGTTGGVWVIDKERARTRGGEQPHREHQGSGLGWGKPTGNRSGEGRDEPLGYRKHMKIQ